MGRSFLITFLIVGAHAQGVLAFGSEPRTHRIERVIDGDTVILENKEHVRLIGVNAPEYEPWKNIIEPCGLEAREFMEREFHGKNVILELGAEPRDRYGRTLAYLFLSDGRMVNEILVREGYARAKAYRPNVKYQQKLEAAARSAKIHRAGCIE